MTNSREDGRDRMNNLLSIMRTIERQARLAMTAFGAERQTSLGQMRLSANRHAEAGMAASGML